MQTVQCARWLTLRPSYSRVVVALPSQGCQNCSGSTRNLQWELGVQSHDIVCLSTAFMLTLPFVAASQRQGCHIN